MSFWKHEPPNPTEAFKNFGPIRLSLPAANVTSSTSAPVASQSADKVFTEEIRCARSAFDTSFESSLDQRFAVRMRSRGTHREYTLTRRSEERRVGKGCRSTGASE